MPYSSTLYCCNGKTEGKMPKIMQHLHRLLLAAAVLSLTRAGGQAPAAPVRVEHPRILLTPAVKAQLLKKKNANDPSWSALKARADVLATYAIFPYNCNRRGEEPDNTIF